MSFKYESISDKDNAVEELFSAIGACQSEFPALPKSAKGQAGGGRFNYVPLDQVIEGMKPQLKEYGVSYSQLLHSEDKESALTLVVAGHGALVSTTFKFARDRNPQDAGKQVTYYRRYQLLSFFGIVGDQDADSDSVEDNKSRYENKVIEERLEAAAHSVDKQVVGQASTTVESEPFIEKTEPLVDVDTAEAQAVQHEGNGNVYAVERDGHLPTIKNGLKDIKSKLGWDMQRFTDYASRHGLFPKGVTAMRNNTYDGYADLVDHLMNNETKLRA